MANNNRLRDWSRFAVKLGLLLTDPKVRAEINNQLKSRVDDVSDTISSKYDTLTSKYEDAVDRLDAASSALRGRNNWQSPAVGFLLGVGVGAGLGLLLAPVSGTEAREVIRDKAVEMKNRVVNSKNIAVDEFRHSAGGFASTGTEG